MSKINIPTERRELKMVNIRKTAVALGAIATTLGAGGGAAYGLYNSPLKSALAAGQRFSCKKACAGPDILPIAREQIEEICSGERAPNVDKITGAGQGEDFLVPKEILNNCGDTERKEYSLNVGAVVISAVAGVAASLLTWNALVRIDKYFHRNAEGNQRPPRVVQMVGSATFGAAPRATV